MKAIDRGARLARSRLADAGICHRQLLVVEGKPAAEATRRRWPVRERDDEAGLCRQRIEATARGWGAAGTDVELVFRTRGKQLADPLGRAVRKVAAAIVRGVRWIAWVGDAIEAEKEICRAGGADRLDVQQRRRPAGMQLRVGYQSPEVEAA